MDMHEVRRQRLRGWVDDHGGQAAVIKKNRLTPSEASYLSQLLGGYSFGERAARNWERKLSLNASYLDGVDAKDLAKRTHATEGTPPLRHQVTTKPADNGRQGGQTVPALRAKPDDVTIPLSSAVASMGEGLAIQAHEEVVSYMTIDRAWLSRNCSYTAVENLGLITGFGDSMKGAFEDGDVLLVDRGVTDIKLDAIYAIELNDELFIKRLQRRPDGTLLMISENKSYEPYRIADAERERMRVLGRVIMAWNARRL